MAEGKFNDDLVMQKNIMSLLHGHTELDISKVHLHVKAGYVSINGIVQSPDEKATIEAFVAKAPGVKDVVNFLQLERGIDTLDGHGFGA